MFEKLSPKSIKIVMVAQEEARRFLNSFVLPEHLLLGILRETGTTAHKLLNDRGITYEDVLEKIKNDTDNRSSLIRLEMQFSPTTRQAVEMASDEAERLNKPLAGGGIAKVIESKDENFKEGEIVLGMLPWSTESIVTAKGFQKVDSNVPHLSNYLGILGMPGLTAYFGLLDIGKPKAGETVVVSGAAGAVGLVVGQIAKIYGCHVVGIAGSDEKVQMLKEKFGFDEAINYKTENVEEMIGKTCPKGVGIYFDNVGGEISDVVVKHINFHARIPLCGQISLYNAKEVPVGPRL